MKEATNSYKSLDTILNYFGSNKEDYWHIDYKIIDFEPNLNYYWDLSRKYTEFNGEYDGNKVPLYRGSDGKNYYSSIFLGHYALGAYQNYLSTKCQNSYNDFILISDWFVENQEKYIECNGIWINRYPMSTFALSNEWSSCLSQAKGISTLIRAFHLTSNTKYMTSALNSAESFLTPKEKGGVAVFINNDIFFEEYTTKTNSIVLNGHIFAIFAIFDLLRILKNKPEYTYEYDKYNQLFKTSIFILENNLFRWDTISWSKYDIWDKHYNISSLFYHRLHIKQLKILFNITKIDSFNDQALKWEKRANNIFYRMYSLARKIYFRLKK